MKTVEEPFKRASTARNTLLPAIKDVLGAGSFCGAYVSGTTGMGKSVLSRTLIEDLGEDFVPFLLTPAASLAGVPYGALAPLLASATSSDLESPRTTLRALLAFLRQSSGGKPVLVVVDDAHLLDDSTGYVLSQLASSRVIHLVAFARPGTSVSAELETLCKDGLLREFELEALESDDALELCTQTLGGPVMLGASDRLRSASSGNPLLLGALLEEALHKGALTEFDGVWGLNGGELPIPRALVDFLRSIIIDFSDGERRAFELLALGGAFSFQQLVQYTSEEVVAALLRDGLIQRSPRYPLLAVLTHALYGRIARMLIPVGRSCALRQEVTPEDPGTRPLPSPTAIRRALWALECGESIHDDQLLGLAQEALATLDPESALKLLAATVSARRSSAARLYQAEALLELSRLEESSECSRGILEQASEPELIAAAGVLEIRQRLADGAGADAVEEVTERWSKALASRSELATDPATAAAVVSAEERLVVFRALAWNRAGRHGETVAALEPMVSGATDAMARILAAAALIEALENVGRGVDARSHASTLLLRLRESRLNTGYLHREVTLRQVGALVQGGQVSWARSVIKDYSVDEVPDHGFLSGSLAVLSGALAVRAGQFGSGVRTLRPALAALRGTDPDGILPFALGLAAWSASGYGSEDSSARFREELAVTTSPGSSAYTLLGRAFAEAAALRTQGSADPADLLDLAADARAHGWVACEKDILVLAVLFDDQEPARLLLGVTRTMQGTEASALNAYAAALIARDPSALVAAGDRLEVLELVLLATEACRRAMELYAAAGDVRSQRLLAPVFRRRRLLIDGTLFGEPGEEPGGAPLTSREREIAMLTLAGFSNRDIAQKLTISVRTVEGHLYRIFVKLGITRREELTPELEPSLLAM